MTKPFSVILSQALDKKSVSSTPQSADWASQTKLASLHYIDQSPYLTVSDHFGSLTLPLCVASGLDTTDLSNIDPKQHGLLISKNHLGTAVFFLGAKANGQKNCSNLVARALEHIKFKTSSFWVNQGDKLSANEYVNVNGNVYTNRQCYLKALDCNIQNSYAWGRLGQTLETNETVVVDDIPHRKIDCLARSLMIDDRSSAGWYDLARIVEITDKNILVNDKKYSVAQCYVKSLSINNKSANTWHGLGCNLNLTQQKSILVGRKLMSEKQCYVKSLELDSTHSQSWLALASTLDEKELVIISNKQYSKNGCFQQALDSNPLDADTWSGVGATLLKDQEFVDSQGSVYNRLKCQIKAVAIDKNIALPWARLGEILNNYQTIKIDGELYTSRGCYVKALELDSKVSQTWNNLGAILLPYETVTISGEVFTEQDCYKKALALSPNHKNILENARFIAPTPSQYTEVTSIDTDPAPKTTLRQRHVSSTAN